MQKIPYHMYNSWDKHRMYKQIGVWKMEVFDSFFGTEIKKELDLLRLLYRRKQFIEIDEISRLLGMDRRSVNKYYELLTKKPYLNSVDHQKILLSKHGAGYRFNGTKKDYKILFKQILQSSPYFDLLRSLLTEEGINIAKFAYENFLSESTVRKKIYELENLLKGFDFSLKKTKGSVFLMGDERKIRFFMVAFLWQTFSGLYWPFPNIAQKKCEQIAKDIYQQSGVQVSTIDLKLSCYVLAVTILRYRKGFKLEEQNLNWDPHFSEDDQTILSQLIYTQRPAFMILEKELRTHFLLPASDIEFIFLLFLSNSSLSLTDEQLELFFDEQRTKNTSFSKIQTIITTIMNTSDLSVQHAKNKEKLITKTILSGILFVELFGKMDFTITGYNIKQYLMLKFPNLFLQAQNLLADQEIYSQNNKKQEGLSLYTAIAWSVVISPTRFNQQIRIKIETDLPLPIELAIMERVQTTFQGFYNIKVSNHFPKENYDICLSTTPITELETNKKVLLINSQVSLSDSAGYPAAA
jgi:DNA-binding CsgD family transcriptional regulator